MNDYSKQKALSLEIKYVNVPGLEKGVTKTGQDAVMIRKIKVNNIEYNVFGVFDGHGDHGHHLSSFIRKNLILVFKHFLKKDQHSLKKVINLTIEYLNDRIAVISKEYNKRSSFENIPSDKNFNAEKSGTTCVLTIITQGQIYSVSLGDSRALIGVLDRTTNPDKPFFVPVQITVEHNTSNKKEQQRVISKGGLIKQYTNEHGKLVGPLRVWNSEERYPGLVVTRSFGDLIGKKCGISGTAVILQKTIISAFKCLVIGSDGLWDMLDNFETLEKIYFSGRINVSTFSL